MIREDLAEDLLARMGTDRWNELINVLRMASNHPLPMLDFHSLPSPIRIELDQDSKMKLDNLSCRITGIESAIYSLEDTLREIHGLEAKQRNYY